MSKWECNFNKNNNVKTATISSTCIAVSLSSSYYINNFLKISYYATKFSKSFESHILHIICKEIIVCIATILSI